MDGSLYSVRKVVVRCHFLGVVGGVVGGVVELHSARQLTGPPWRTVPGDAAAMPSVITTHLTSSLPSRRLHSLTDRAGLHIAGADLHAEPPAASMPLFL